MCDIYDDKNKGLIYFISFLTGGKDSNPFFYWIDLPFPFFFWLIVFVFGVVGLCWLFFCGPATRNNVSFVFTSLALILSLISHC